MKHTGSTSLILFFIGLCYFIFPHHPYTLSQKVSAHTTLSVIHLASVHVSPTLAPTSMPIPTPAPVIASDIDAFLLTQVNAYRSSLGLGVIHTNASVCAFAQVRAGEITANFSHDGFTTRIDNKILPYASYSLVTENIATNPTYQDVVPAWENSSGHAANMRADTPYGCIVHSGNYYVYEGWKP